MEHFYGDDELWGHMQQHHFLCQLCQRAGIPHLYFVNAAALREHNGAAHHVCSEPECHEALVVFTSEEELKNHYLARWGAGAGLVSSRGAAAAQLLLCVHVRQPLVVYP
jgi:hypothetical protein